jgi:hypothetical protein
MPNAGRDSVKRQNVCRSDVTISWRTPYFLCRCFKASSNSSRMTLPRVLRSSSARRSISSNKSAGSRTDTPTDSGSCLFFAISTRPEGYRDVMFRVNPMTCDYQRLLVITLITSYSISMSAYRRRNHDFNARLQSLQDERQRKSAFHFNGRRPERCPRCGNEQIVVAPHDYDIDRRFKEERKNMLDRMDIE